MSEFVNQIKSFNRFKLINFYNLVFFDKEELGQVVLQMIKSLHEEEQTLLIKIFKTITDVTWLSEELQKISCPSNEEMSLIQTQIAHIFENELPSIIEQVKENTAKLKEQIFKDRDLLKAELVPFYLTDQMLGVDFPPVQKTVDEDQLCIDLPSFDKKNLIKNDLFDCVKDRESHRTFTNEALSLNELSYLLWATQGVRQKFNNDKQTRRTVPSGGSRHPFETYLAVNNVEGLNPGIYRYQPLQHQLVFLHEVENLKEKLIKYSYEQTFVGECALTFIWAVIPYRTEWRYGLLSKKDILLDCGHLAQNLYLTAESINCGTCGICAYIQKDIDEMLKIDGKDEFTIYLAPLGKVSK